jgi:hypothetical protein
MNTRTAHKKNRGLDFLIAGMVLLAVFGFNLTSVLAHGHGHAGHGGHHGEHSHEHFSGSEHQHEGSDSDSHYHHSHGDDGDHHHQCRSIEASGAQTGVGHDPTNEECQNHDGEWEPIQGD